MLTFYKCTLLSRAALTWREGLPILHTVAFSVNHCVDLQPYVDGTKRPVFFISLIIFNVVVDAAVERGLHQRYGRAHVYTVYICEHLTDGTLLVP